LLALKDLMGTSLDDPLILLEKLTENTELPAFANSENNADIKFLQSKKTEAETGLMITKSLSKPNIFAIGNYQFFRKDLPLITPPWLVGIEMWTLLIPKGDPEIRHRNPL
jgi:hypothetical protein